MSDITRCPRCSVWYRITPEILERAGGIVRCGRCGETFDARAQLWVAEDLAGDGSSTARRPPPPSPPERQSSSETETDDANEGKKIGPARDEPRPSQEREPEYRLGDLDDLGLGTSSGAEPGFELSEEAVSGRARSQSLVIPPEEPIRSPRPRPRRQGARRLPWIIGNVVLLALLGASLVALHPWGRSSRSRSTPLPADEALAARSRPWLFRITAADVVASRRHPRTALVVAGTVLNTSKHSEALPWLLIRLTDVSGKTVAIGDFPPAAYAAGGAVRLDPDTALGFRLRVLAPMQAAAGFRIELCRGTPPRLLCR